MEEKTNIKTDARNQDLQSKSDFEPVVMPAYEFDWQNYIGTMGYSSDECWDFDRNKPKNGYVIIGETDAKNLTIRPRNGKAVMLIDMSNYEKFWLHI